MLSCLLCVYVRVGVCVREGEREGERLGSELCGSVVQCARPAVRSRLTGRQAASRQEADCKAGSR